MISSPDPCGRCDVGAVNTRTSWGWVARLLHWLTAGVILFMLGLGFYMVEVLSAQDSETLMERFSLTQTHKSWGFVAFVLVLLRLIWRTLSPPPALPEGLSSGEGMIARGGHIALYVCMIAMPVSGWLMASASPLQDVYGIKNMVFQQFSLPDPFQPGSEELDTLFKRIHFYVGISLVLLVAGHVLAALKHQFVNKNGLIRRMLLG